MQQLRHIFQLGIKELLSLARDPVLLFLIAYRFTFSVYTPSKSAVMDVVNASIAIVNEDDSDSVPADTRCMLPPLFLPRGEHTVRRDQSRQWTPANTPSSWTCRRNSSTTWRGTPSPRFRSSPTRRP